MNGTKMSKVFFFQMIEERLEELAKEVEKLKANEDISFNERLARENILFGRLSELHTINFKARDVDYWKYTELDKKIYEVKEKI